MQQGFNPTRDIALTDYRNGPRAAGALRTQSIDNGPQQREELRPLHGSHDGRPNPDAERDRLASSIRLPARELLALRNRMQGTPPEGLHPSVRAIFDDVVEYVGRNYVGMLPPRAVLLYSRMMHALEQYGEALDRMGPVERIAHIKEFFIAANSLATFSKKMNITAASILLRLMIAEDDRFDSEQSHGQGRGDWRDAVQDVEAEVVETTNEPMPEAPA